MKWSQFVFVVDSYENKILFNTLNKAVISLPNFEYEQMNLFINKSIIMEDNVQNDFNKLVEMEFILPLEISDKDMFADRFFNSNLNKKLDVTILTTTKCNFSCQYCYENGIDREYYLNKDDSYEIVEYLDKYFKTHKLDKVNLCFFGGEPTLNWNFIEGILPLLKTKCAEYNIILETEIITNGYLLINSKVDFLCDYNLTNIQITLDGPKTVHDSCRKLRNQEGTFDAIINNMKYILSKGKHIDLRVNYNVNSVNSISELLDYIKITFAAYINNIHFSFGAIENTKNEKDNNKNYLTNTEIEKYYLRFYEICKKNNYKISDFFELGALCMAKRKNSIIISSDKKLYKCLSMVGRESGVEGDLSSNIENVPDYLFSDLYDSCFEKECEFIPICHTGCRFASYIHNNSLHKEHCNYDMLKNINKEILKVIHN